MVIEAAIWAEQGRSRAEILGHIEELRPLVRASFVVDTLLYLYRGGRCSGLAAMAGSMLMDMDLPGAQPAAEEILSYRPDVQTELTLIENRFAAILKDIKKKICGKMEESRAEVLTKSVWVQIRNELQKGDGKKSLRKITASQMADAVVTVMSDFDGVTPEMQKNLKAALIPYFSKPMKGKTNDQRGTMR